MNDATDRRPRVVDVATRAGVSAGTVSNVLNRRTTVKPDVRDRVLAAIEELGYVPNISARSLRPGFGPTLGVIIPDLANPAYSALVSGVQDRLAVDTMTPMVCSSQGDPEREDMFMRMFAEQRVRGVLITPSRRSELHSQALRDRGVPLLTMDTAAPLEDDLTSLGMDDLGGARDAVTHLVELGHTTIGMVSGPQALPLCHDQLAGARQAVDEAGGEVRLTVSEHRVLRAEQGRAGALQLFSDAEHRPTALFCATDLMALGAMRELQRLGLRVPEDVSVVGYGDAPFSAELPVPLTSVRQPMHEMGWRAADLMLTAVPGRVMFSPELVVRASSAPCPAP